MALFPVYAVCTNQGPAGSTAIQQIQEWGFIEIGGEPALMLFKKKEDVQNFNESAAVVSIGNAQQLLWLLKKVENNGVRQVCWNPTQASNEGVHSIGDVVGFIARIPPEARGS